MKHAGDWIILNALVSKLVGASKPSRRGHEKDACQLGCIMTRISLTAVKHPSLLRVFCPVLKKIDYVTTSWV